MSKEILVEAVVDRCEMKKGEAKEVVDVILEALFNSITSNEETKLSGFGVFKQVARAARTGRNPKTGESVSIAAKTAVKFKPSAALKQSVNS